jgi:hypothetical protein
MVHGTGQVIANRIQVDRVVEPRRERGHGLAGGFLGEGRRGTGRVALGGCVPLFGPSCRKGGHVATVGTVVRR